MSLLLLLLPAEGGIPPIADQYVRRIDEWELSYALGSTSIFRCVLVDPRSDKENAYRPANDLRVEIWSAAITPIFRGRIVTVSDRPLEEPNVGTRYSISCIGESEIFESRHVTGTFGSDPFPISVSFNSVGGSTTVHTQDPHGFLIGDEIAIEGVTHPTGIVSPINGDRLVATVINANEFTVAIGTQVGDAYGGSVRKKIRLRTLLQALENPYLTDYDYSLAPDILLGPLLEVQKFDNATINDVYRHLSKVTGWVHRYLPNRVVEWFETGTKASVLSFARTNVLSGTGWTQSRVKKANTVILKYGGDQQIATTETVIGNGVQREWPLVHKPVVNRPISSTSARISLIVEGGGESGYRHVGVNGYDTLFEWTYRESDNTLVQLEAAGGGVFPPKPAGWRAVAYITEQLPGTVREQDDDLVAVQGPREKLLQAPGIVDRNAAIQLAKAELGGLVVTPKEAKLVTEDGLTWPGNSSEVDLPHIKMTGPFLITGVTAVENEHALRYTYTAIEGNEFKATWQQRLRDLFGGGDGGGSSVISGSITTLPGGGGGGGTVLGTTNKIPVFTSQTTIGDSVLEQPNENLVSTPAAIQADQGFQSNIFKGITSGAIDASFQNASGLAVFDVPTTTRNARFYGDVITGRVTSETDLALGSANNVVYPIGNYQTHLGGITRKWLTVHAAELWVEQLVAQETISTIGGSILVAPTTTLEADLPLAATSIVVKHNSMVIGNRVMMKSFGKFEVMIITSGPTGVGPYTYGVTRDHDGSGATDWYAGDAVVDTQNSFIDIYSMRGTKSALEKGPTLVGNVRTGTGAVDWEPRWALGNLNGIYGYATDVYGFAAGVRTGAWIAMEPTNGFRMMFNNSVFAQITVAGAASFTGSVTVTGGNAATTDLANVTAAAIQTKSGWGHPSNTTLINGANIFTGTVTLSALNFTPVTTSNVVATINASGEGIQISASRLAISGVVVFTGGAAADVNANATTISGGKITAATITADKLSVTTLSAITANLGTVNAGTITGVTINGASINAGPSNAITINSSGITIPDGTSVSGYRIKMGDSSIWGGTGSAGIRTSGGLFANGNLGCDGTLFTQGQFTAATTIRWTGSDSQNAGIGNPLVIASDDFIHVATNGISGNFSGGTFTFENGICVGHF